MKRNKEINEALKTVYSVMNESVFEFPVPIEKIIKAFNIAKFEYDFGEEISGVFVFEDERKRIGYNNNISPNSLNFLLAYFLGLHLLNPEECLFLQKKSFHITPLLNHKDHKKACGFALELLLPELLIKNEFYLMFNNAKYSDEDILKHISKLSKINIHLVTLRFINLNILNL